MPFKRAPKEVVYFFINFTATAPICSTTVYLLIGFSKQDFWGINQAVSLLSKTINAWFKRNACLTDLKLFCVEVDG